MLNDGYDLYIKSLHSQGRMEAFDKIGIFSDQIVGRTLAERFRGLRNLTGCIDQDDYNDLKNRIITFKYNPELYTEVLDFISVNNILWHFRQQEIHLEDFMKALTGILDDSIRGKIEKYLIDKLLLTIIDTEDLKSFDEFGKCALKMSKENKEFFSQVLYLQTSNLVMQFNKSIKELGASLSDMKSLAQLNYEIVEDLVQRYFQVLEYNSKYITRAEEASQKRYPVEKSEDVEESIQGLCGFPFRVDHGKTYEDFLTVFKVELQIKEPVVEARDRVDFLTVNISTAPSHKIQEILIDMDSLPVKGINQLTEVKFTEEISTQNKLTDIELYRSPKVVVYKAMFQQKLVAVKKFQKDSREKTIISFAKQAQIMLKMRNHENFLDIFGAFYDEVTGNGVLVMELCDYTLEKYSISENFKNYSDYEKGVKAYQIGQKLVRALHELNNRGISHKDIKPQNILINLFEHDVCEVKITDFDVSSLRKRKSEHSISVTGSVVGTSDFASPEVRRYLSSDNKEIKVYSNKSDVYSLGLTLLFMVLKNKEKIAFYNGGDRLQENVNCAVDDNALYPELNKMLKKMLKIDVEERACFKDLIESNYETVKIDDSDEVY